MVNKLVMGTSHSSCFAKTNMWISDNSDFFWLHSEAPQSFASACNTHQLSSYFTTSPECETTSTRAPPIAISINTEASRLGDGKLRDRKNGSVRSPPQKHFYVGVVSSWPGSLGENHETNRPLEIPWSVFRGDSARLD